MKYLKYLLGFFALLLLFILGKGFFTPSVYYESEIVVNKSAKEAWAVMSDEENLPKWIDGFKRSELVSGPANTVGAVTNVYVEDNGEEMVMVETIMQVKTYELLAMKFTMDFMDMDYEMLFSEKGGKTRIQTKSTTFGNGIMAKSMISFMTAAMKSQEDENLGNLKKLIEENTKNYFQDTPVERVEVVE